MILAVHNSVDPTAERLVCGLRSRGLAVEAVSVEELVFGSSWVFEMDTRGTTWHATLADGRKIESRYLDGLMNRAVPEPAAKWWPQASAEDATYAAEEWRAHLLSALSAIRGPQINPPTPSALAGPVWHACEWRSIALGHGLEIADQPLGIAGSEACLSATVVGSQVFSDLDSTTSRRCAQLAVDLDCPFMEIFFDENGRSLFGTSLPEVPEPGDSIVDALAEHFFP